MKTIPTIHAATAMFPGESPLSAIEKITAGVAEPLYGPVSAAHLQVCPQNPGWLSPGACEQLVARFPGTQLRLHANARVQTRHRLLDASTFGPDTLDYYEDLADRSRRLGAKAYSLHAGYATNCDLATMIDNVWRIQDLFGPECTVAVEGLYPSERRPHLMDTWQAYEAVLKSGLSLAIDMSHLKIVARMQGTRDTGLVRELVASPQTIEVHVSDNNAVADTHSLLVEAPWWWGALPDTHPDAVVFSESNLGKAERRAPTGRLCPLSRTEEPRNTPTLGLQRTEEGRAEVCQG